MKIIGDIQYFAIEYDIVQPEHPTKFAARGHARIWINGHFIGAIQNESYLYHIYGALLKLAKRLDKLPNPCKARSPLEVFDFIIESKADIECLSVDQYFLGLGDAFDDFTVVCYCEENFIIFLWKLVGQPFFDYPDYPIHVFWGKVEIEYCTKVADELRIESEKINSK